MGVNNFTRINLKVVKRIGYVSFFIHSNFVFVKQNDNVLIRIQSCIPSRLRSVQINFCGWFLLLENFLYSS